MDMSHRPYILRFAGLKLSYRQGPREVSVLKGASGEFLKGEAVGLVAPSGGGKSSLLHVLGLLEKPNEGEVYLGDLNCSAMTDAQRTAIRRTEFGFIYQFHQLLPEFTALENVVMPQLIAGIRRKEAEEWAKDLLANIGLGDRLSHLPAEMSGGEQQRVAIVRAVANQPKVLLADEPTGNLDPYTAEQVFDGLIELVHEQGLCTIMATHNIKLAGKLDRVVCIENGQVVEGSVALA